MKGDRTYSFGTGREGFTKTVVNRHKYPDAAVPSPGEYDPQKRLGKEAVAFKFKDRFPADDVAFQAKKKNYPGAGTYEDVLCIENN